MKISMKSVCLAALVALSGGAASAATVYSDNATNFNGEYRGVGTFTKDFTAPAGKAALSFDLFGANSVDGYGNGWDDLFTIALNGVDVFSGYFSLSGGGTNKVILNTLGWAWTVNTNPGGNFAGGITSVSGFANLLNDNTFSVTFAAVGPNNGGGQSLGDESWALNDLKVSPVPLPAALPMLGAALAGLGIAARRRRRG